MATKKSRKGVGGRPRKIQTPKQLWDEFIKYIEICKENKDPITKTGFKAHLTVNHGYLSDLTKEFSEVKKKIDTVMEYEYEKGMLKGKNYGAYIFALTNHYKRTNQRNENKNINANFNKDVTKMSDDELYDMMQS